MRNPEFEEWSRAAQPDGFVDRVSWRFRENLAGAFGRLNAGELDLMLETPLPEDLATLRSEHPDQVIAWPGFFTFYVGFDVAKPPFDDEGLRQALNYALDRDHIVDLLGGSAIQRPTCQILPPNLQGYAPFCPYTLEPEAGVWSSPDLDRARALVEDAGADGEKVTVSVANSGLPDGAVETMRYVTDVLNDLGVQAELEIERSGPYFDAIYAPAGTPDHPHVFVTGWISDYPGAGNWLGPQFYCGARGFANPSGWCDPALDAGSTRRCCCSRPTPAPRTAHGPRSSTGWSSRRRMLRSRTRSRRTRCPRGRRTCRSTPSGASSSAGSGSSSSNAQLACSRDERRASP